MTIEAMKQALELICSARLCEVNSMSSRKEMLRLMSEAADTLRAAIEHAERPMTHSADCWRWHHACARAWIERNKHKSDGKEVLASTAPRQWQGLTDEERKSIREWQRIQEELGPVWAPMMLYLHEAIEAKLKEKNG